MIRYKLPIVFATIFFVGIAYAKTNSHDQATSKVQHKYSVVKTDKEWQKILSPSAYHILREKGTEMAFSGKYADNHEKGTYYCTACKNELFSSEAKFESGTGWPSFYQPISKGKVLNIVDSTYGMTRTEVVCARCGGHLGHVFDDGPKPTGLRYCMNSDAMNFIKDKK